MPVFNKMVYNGTEYILGGGGNIGEPLNLTVTTSGLDATIKWEDNEIGTIPPTTFQKSELVRKIGSAPTSPSDGVLVVTETVKDTYKVSGYVDQGLTDGETYYYRVFSYSDLGGISYCDAVNVTPSGGGWQPGVNTIAYFPFKSDILDYSGNGITWDSGAGTFANNMITTTSNLRRNSGLLHNYSGDFTVLVYIDYSNSDSLGAIAPQGDGGYYPLMQFYLDTTNIDAYPAGVFIKGWKCPSYGSALTGIHLVVMKRSGDSIYTYVDGTEYGPTACSGYIGQNGGSGDTMLIGGMGSDTKQVTCGNLIVEDRAWTQQEIADYFNATKGDYGIS